MAFGSAPSEVFTPVSAGQYRALSLSAVVSFVFGVLSVLTALWLPLLLIPLAGLTVGWLSQRRILGAPEEWTGLNLARWGMAASVILGVVGSGFRLANTREVPFGYTRITYDDLQPDPNRPTQLVPERATEMNDKKVFIKGFMQPRRQHTGIRDFVMGPANSDCKFCTHQPKPTEMIRVVLQGDKTTTYTSNQVGVAGRLRVDPSDPKGLPYSLDAESVRQ